ncbi:hypothetical protein P4V86_18430 [Brevibacillus laterosporus]|uniref:hypothetical protein n=1 Tax=Brevibacillus laterosporus TaxID=1465 RepID=UPI0003658021|nr:hypothetical protein [Brevibacillus laterosporus]MED2005317.1 hypothetical protein [Brevibacillus laterosporus]
MIFKVVYGINVRGKCYESNSEAEAEIVFCRSRDAFEGENGDLSISEDTKYEYL